ncbi:MAG: hypothetical protein VX986_06600 [Pseudomonadota bacterium]|nr:hypothetical protein [Pseudomonadota bacterium]
MIKRQEIMVVVLLGSMLTGCSGNSQQKNDAQDSLNQTTTPRNILNARIVNRGENDNFPYLTVGKFVELADRYQSCQCTTSRFVRRWEKTKTGYLLYSYFNDSQPIEFTCDTTKDDVSCFVREVDRGVKIQNLNERFAPGSSLIKFIYDKGVRCMESNPCQ